MSGHDLAVVKLQAQDLTPSLDLGEGVLAPPPVFLQGLGNTSRHRMTLGKSLDPTTNLPKYNTILYNTGPIQNNTEHKHELCSYNSIDFIAYDLLFLLTWISLVALW